MIHNRKAARETKAGPRISRMTRMPPRKGGTGIMRLEVPTLLRVIDPRGEGA